MGCDIHIIAEVKENGVWKRNTDKVFKNHWYNPERWEQNISGWEKRLDDGEITQEDFNNWIKRDSLGLNIEFKTDPNDNRNYDWFAVLADVRNGRGFAGVSTGEGFNVMAMPKDLPDDASNDTIKFFCNQITDDEELFDEEIEDEDGNYLYYVSRKTANKWMLDGYSKIIHIDGNDYVTNPDYHSTSYLSIDELDMFDWNQVTMKYGTISLEQYKKLRGTNESPDSWSGFISGGDHITISEEEADKIINGENIMLTRDNVSMFRTDVEPETKPADEWTINVKYQWSILYSEWFKNRIEDTIIPLSKLKEKYEDARIVFSFDN